MLFASAYHNDSHFNSTSTTCEKDNYDNTLCLIELMGTVLMLYTQLILLTFTHSPVFNFTMSAMSLLLLVSVAIVIGQGETASYCLTDQCTTDHPPSLYEQYCCNADNLGKIFKITDDNKKIIILCSNTLPSSCSRLVLDGNYSSCSDVLTQYPDAVSGYYNITLNNGSIASVYCDMEGDNCDGEGGWMRVANINMTLPDAICPDGLTLYDINGQKACSFFAAFYDGCPSIIFPSYQYSYSKVYGQVRGYKYHYPAAFVRAVYDGAGIDSVYAAGVSITYDSSPRKHIWTYAGGAYEDRVQYQSCPCNTGYPYSLPSYIGDNYYCESSSTGYDDILWDGQQCNGLESPCCTAPNMPWFTTTLDDNTTSDIEVRACSYYSNGHAPFDIIQLYIK